MTLFEGSSSNANRIRSPIASGCYVAKFRCIIRIFSQALVAMNYSIIILSTPEVPTHMKSHNFLLMARTMGVVVFLLSSSLVLVLPTGNAASHILASNHTDLLGVNVAVYYTTDAVPSSAVALYNMFAWMNATVEFVNGTLIRNGALNNCDIIAFPGGSYVSYRNDLETDGIAIIRDFVRNGGSYFGICAGALFATYVYLGFFNGSFSNPINGTGMYLTQMLVNRNSTGPDLSSEPESYQTMYWGSSYFYGQEISGVIPIANYSMNNKPGMIALHYSYGTVFLSSPHPEYEEGSDRDGTNFGDYLNDPDTEWNMLLKVSCWLVDASAVSITNSGTLIPEYLQMLTLGGVGVFRAVFVVIIVRSRRL
jgi:glutamine amidotransferase-like uncharacterized protein